MAQTLYCDGCETEPAAMIIQMIGTPDVLAFCPPCSLTWAEAHVAVMRDALGITTPAEPETAGSGQLAAAAAAFDTEAERVGAETLAQLPPPPDGLPISGIPFKDDPRGIPIGIADTPDGLPAPDPAADESGSNPGDNLATEAPEGGVTDGELRAHDPGPDAGDRPATDRPGPDDAGEDRQGRPGEGRGGREGERERRRSARSGVRPQAGP